MNGGSSGGGMGGGYNIPISLSAASTFSVPQTQSAPTYVVYGSSNRVGGDTDVSPTNYAPATATSSAALGGDSTAQTGAQGGLSLPGGGQVSQSTVIIIAVAVVVVGLGIAAAIYLKGR